MNRMNPWFKRAMLLLVAALGVGPLGLASAGEVDISDGVVKIGLLTDMSGAYSDVVGEGAVIAAKMAIDDFGGKVAGRPIQLVVADHQLKPDVASTTARKWFDQDQVDMVVDVNASSAALAVMPLAKDKKKILFLSSPGTTSITGALCNPYTIHYTYNTWALANGTGREVVSEGGKTWYFLTADYAFGKALEQDTSDVVRAAGGKVLGSIRHPFPGTTDFSSFVLQAQSSGAAIIGLANAGGDTVNAIRSANEYGLTKTQKLAGLLVFIPDIHTMGLALTKGMYLTTAFYWDMDDQTRAFAKRFRDHPENKKKAYPNMAQAGIYSATMHYLEAVQALKSDNSDKVVAKMKEMPVNDFFARNGRIGPDGLHRHDMYLAQVKSPEESKYPWDYYRIVKRIPAAQAFPTVEQQNCSFAK
jgi:branched-chain amino acid transport system substrate-binding protein